MLLVLNNNLELSDPVKVSEDSDIYTDMTEVHDNSSGPVLNRSNLTDDPVENNFKNNIDIAKSSKNTEKFEDTVKDENSDILLVNGISNDNDSSKDVYGILDNNDDVNKVLNNINELCSDNIENDNVNDDHPESSSKENTDEFETASKHDTSSISLENNMDDDDDISKVLENIDELCNNFIGDDKKNESEMPSKNDTSPIRLEDDVNEEKIEDSSSVSLPVEARDDETDKSMTLERKLDESSSISEEKMGVEVTLNSSDSSGNNEKTEEILVTDSSDVSKTDIMEVDEPLVVNAPEDVPEQITKLQVDEIEDNCDNKNVDGSSLSDETLRDDTVKMKVKQENGPLLKDDNMVYIAFPSAFENKENTRISSTNGDEKNSTEEGNPTEKQITTVKVTEGKKTRDSDIDDDLLMIDDNTANKQGEEESSSASEAITGDNTVANNTANLQEIVLDDDDDNVVPVDNLENKKSPETTVCSEDKEPQDVNMSTTSNDVLLDKKALGKKSDIKIEDRIIPLNFMKTFKSSLGKMTRDELEEFCVVKIVETIVKRSNLNETEAKLKSQLKSVDALRKKLALITKQNRELEIIMKNLCNEHKRRKGDLIEPVKISRSVGFQVGTTNIKVKNTKTNIVNAVNPVSTPQKQTKPNKPLPPTLNTPNVAKSSGNPNNKKAPILSNSPDPQNDKNRSGTPMKSILRNVLSYNNSNKNVVPKQADKRMLDTSIDLTDDEPPTKQMTTNNRSKVVVPKNQNQSNSNAANASKVFSIRPQQIANAMGDMNVAHKYGRNPNTPSGIVSIPAVRPININNPNLNSRISIPIRMGTTTATAANRSTIHYSIVARHPAPLPVSRNIIQTITGKWLPPKPELKISRVSNGIVISWTMENAMDNRYEDIASYQIWAYQETNAPPHTELWKKIGHVEALPLPMACTLTQFMAGYKYYFAVRAVDVKSRMGPFSTPGNITLNL